MAEPAAASSAQPGSSTNGSELGELKKDELQQALVHLTQGKRHLLVRDVPAAITSLGEACHILVEVNGPLCADNAEAHFYYGKALLEQSRAELAVFDDGTAAVEKGSSSSEEDEEEEEKDDDEDEDEEEEGKEETKENGDKTKEAEAATGEKKEEEDLNVPSPDDAPADAAVEPSTSEETPPPAATAEKEPEEELSNLELAWEVLEVAKLGFTNKLGLANLQLKEAQTDDEKATSLKTKNSLQKRLAETHSLLGEVATESENYEQAVEDFKTGIKILGECDSSDSREIAQYYFQMGLAYSFAKLFQESIKSFQNSKEIIELRIKNLTDIIAARPKDETTEKGKDSSEDTEATELQELKALVPELDEKVQDTIDAEKENKKAIEEEIKEKEIILQCSPVKNPNPPANNISHLVKKKKKADEESQEAPPTKRICFDTSSGNTNGELKDEVSSTNGQNGSTMETS